MTTPATPGDTEKDAAPLRPKMTPEQMLTRLLELIRSSRYRSEFTPERVSRIMGVEVERAEDGSDDYSFYEKVTPDWLQGFNFSTKYDEFTFRFDALPPGASPGMTDVCELDLDKFSVEMEAMGFSKTPHYDSAPPAPPPSFPGSDAQPEHGGLMDYTFHRMKDGKGEMTVIVHPEGERAGSDHLCIRMIQIF